MSSPAEHLPYFELSVPVASLQHLGKRIIQATSILVVSHRNPDGDTIAAGCALAHGLQKLNKDVQLFCCDPIPQSLQFLSLASSYTTTLPTTSPDLIIIVDTNNPNNTGIAPYLERYKDRIIIIDHHIPSESTIGFPVIVPHSCSTTALLYCIFRLLHVPICLDTATALLTGVYWDTGGLQHSNTSYHSYRIAGELVQLGARLDDIRQHILQNKSSTQLRLWGIVLERMQIHPHMPITYSYITQEDFDITGATFDESNGVIDYLNTIPKQWCAILFIQTPHTLRVSLRSQHTEINLAHLASQFGGGGHQKAAGFTLSSTPPVQQQAV